MEIPKTWDQLLDTTSYILAEEQKRGNNDLIGYIALFPSKYNLFIYLIFH